MGCSYPQPSEAWVQLMHTHILADTCFSHQHTIITKLCLLIDCIVKEKVMLEYYIAWDRTSWHHISDLMNR